MVIEPSKSSGGLLVRSFCQAIKCNEYFEKYNLSEILIQTRKIMQSSLNIPIEMHCLCFVFCFWNCFFNVIVAFGCFTVLSCHNQC